MNMDDKPYVWYDEKCSQRPMRYRYRTIPGRLLCCLAYACFALGFLCFFVNLLWPSPILLGLCYGMENGEPTITQRSLPPLGKLSDVAVNDDSLFLLYQGLGVVNAYTHEGEYQYSILFPYHSKRSGVLYARGYELFYNVPHTRTVYQITNGAYHAVYQAEAGADKLAELQDAFPEHQDDRCLYGDAEYLIRGQDVFRRQADGTVQCIVDTPDALALLEFEWLWLGLLLFWLLAGGLGLAARRIELRHE